MMFIIKQEKEVNFCMALRKYHDVVITANDAAVWT